MPDALAEVTPCGHGYTVPVADVRSQIDWSKRSPEFGALQDHVTPWRERLVVMPLRTPGITDSNLDWGLWRLWSDLPQQRSLFEPIATSPTGELLLRYAAIDWTWRPSSIKNERAVRQVATWGVELTRAFDFIMACVPAEERGWFTCPFVKIDINEDLRLGFLNPAGSVELMRRVPPEALESFPAADSRSLVFAIGQLLLGLVEPTGNASQMPLGQVILRCLEPHPSQRFMSLRSLRDALVIVGGARKTPYEDDPASKLFEIALGYQQLDMPAHATALLKQAIALAPAAGLEQAAAELGFDLEIPPYAGQPPTAGEIAEVVRTKEALAAETRSSLETRRLAAHKRTRNWRDVRATARMHVEAGRYGDALALYNTSVLADADAAEILLGTAECHLLASELGTAVDFAEQALARDPKTAQAHAILAEARFKRREFDKALAAVNLWTIALPEDGHAHYVGAKALLGLGRLAEAREACERAMEVAPKHLPAMMLRRQIDRTIQRVRAQAGKAQHAPIDLPEHLRDLRPLLVAGKTAEAIAVLEGPAYANDATAKLLRADLLAFTEQLEAAEAAYATLGGVAAGVGRVLVLVKLGKPSDALAACDALLEEHPRAPEVHEARALALQALHRGSEADEELRRAAAADRQRSQVRVNLAKR